jgi:hypothetical protein
MIVTTLAVIGLIEIQSRDVNATSVNAPGACTYAGLGSCGSTPALAWGVDGGVVEGDSYCGYKLGTGCGKSTRSSGE